MLSIGTIIHIPNSTRMSKKFCNISVWASLQGFPPDRTWHKVSDLKVDYSGDFGEGKV